MSKKTINTADLSSVVTPTGIGVQINVGFHHRVVLTQDGKERELSGRYDNASHYENHVFETEQAFQEWVKANPAVGKLAVDALEAKKKELAI